MHALGVGAISRRKIESTWDIDEVGGCPIYLIFLLTMPNVLRRLCIAII